MARSRSYLAICDGDDDGIPLWSMRPTRDNVPVNTVVGQLRPYRVCVIVMDHADGTSLAAHDGVLAYVVTACLFEVIL